MKKTLNTFYQAALTFIIFLRLIFAGRVYFKTEKIWLNFFKFQYMSILAIHCSRRQEMILMPEYNLKEQN